MADALGAGDKTSFSYGPGPNGAAVRVTDAASPTHIDDEAAWAALSDPGAASKAGISVVPIRASDANIIAAGNRVTASLGTSDNPGEKRYNAAAGVLGPSILSTNSNAAAFAQTNIATKASNPNAPDVNPPPNTNPVGAAAWRDVTTPIPQTEECPPNVCVTVYGP